MVAALATVASRDAATDRRPPPSSHPIYGQYQWVSTTCSSVWTNVWNHHNSVFMRTVLYQIQSPFYDMRCVQPPSIFLHQLASERVHRSAPAIPAARPSRISPCLFCVAAPRRQPQFTSPAFFPCHRETHLNAQQHRYGFTFSAWGRRASTLGPTAGGRTKRRGDSCGNAWRKEARAIGARGPLATWIGGLRPVASAPTRGAETTRHPAGDGRWKDCRLSSFSLVSLSHVNSIPFPSARAPLPSLPFYLPPPSCQCARPRSRYKWVASVLARCPPAGNDSQ